MEIDDPVEAIGKEWLTFWKGNLQNLATEALKKAASGKMSKFEGFCSTFKGNMKYWEVSIASLYGDFGEVQWLLITSKDATKRIEMEQTIKDLNAEVLELKTRAAKQQLNKAL